MSHDERIQTTSEDRLETILCGVLPHGDNRTSPEALQELQELADTGEFAVSGCITQHRRKPDPNYYLGHGKLEELAEIVKQAEVGAVICNDSLSPAQGRNMEKIVMVPILDRSELILHIFDFHAKTPQAKLQVELASLQYQLPRLKRLWTHLERQRGGIGIRGGAGEKQIDIDRSDLRTKISGVRKKLKQIESRRAREVGARSDHFSIALVGYTNAGKSTLMNGLTNAHVLTENRLFSTLDTRTRPWRLPGGRLVLLSDTVGFIRNLPHQLIASFHATLEEALNADLLFLLVDSSSPRALEQLHIVEQALEELGAGHTPRIYILNKLDRLTDQSQLAPLYAYSGKAVAVSAVTGEGLDELQTALQDFLATHEQLVTVLIPHEAAKLHSEIRATTTILSQFYTQTGCLIEMQVSPGMLGRILSRGGSLPDSESLRGLRDEEDNGD